MKFGHNVRMEEPRHRLIKAREDDKRFESPADVAKAVRDINQNTYTSHENGNRPISKDAAARYAELYGVTGGWILFNDPQVVPDGANPDMQKFLALYKAASPLRRKIALDVAMSALGDGSSEDQDEV